MKPGIGFAVLSGAAVLVANSAAQATGYDNGGYDPVLSTGFSSQLDSAYPFESQAADDFVLTTGKTITGVTWDGVYFNPGPPGNNTSFNIEFYLDAGFGVAPTGGPGDPTGTAIATFNVTTFNQVEALIYGNGKCLGKS